MRKLVCFLLLIMGSLAMTSCVTTRHDNGKHKGWYKNPNNPHHPLSDKKKKKKKPRKDHKFELKDQTFFSGAYTPIT
ncbi:hypothetical protein EDD80_101337 [Anseongella ginsenosidimutans]|uniref:Lipoprotein n=1 Tax=Anseongella ginsenosidimutans TaxID=496056 RepID=A0A4R3KXG1_9SPHI|nr:hypothetical protein [Anseongella ginsenosidimutans]QEC51189.1 hypothetical protein FRZ59_01695 [Anseongella ginsenosidimutans]TCS90138.1 hypothetical protein EDD80_101337 [Anseongella ginsenosidimutans]